MICLKKQKKHVFLQYAEILTSCNSANYRPYFSRRCASSFLLRLSSGNMCTQRENRLPVTIELKKLAAALGNAVPWEEGSALVFCRATLSQDACLFRCRFDRLRRHHDSTDVTVGEQR